MNWHFNPVEAETSRLAEQDRLDGAKSKAERNRLGQFATPTALANDILSLARKEMGAARIRFLDPAFGTGSFFAALCRGFPADQIAAAVGYEVDHRYGESARELWSKTLLNVRLEDFTRAGPPKAENVRFNLVVCNPPYVRHHHLTSSEKARLKEQAFLATHVRLSGLAGLYCHFLCLAHEWMQKGGLGIWLIPSEFMTVNYGRAIREFLLTSVQLESIHRFNPNDVQFADALVSSAVVVFRRQLPSASHRVRFSFGGSLAEPRLVEEVPHSSLSSSDKWINMANCKAATREAIGNGETELVLADLFKIKRGIATGENAFFIVDRETAKKRELPSEFLIPILPSPRYLPGDRVDGDRKGIPKIERPLFLISCSMPEPELAQRFPRLYEYFDEGKRSGVNHRFLCAHRSPWYAQEERLAPTYLCSYIGRHECRAGKPFRFVLNESRAIASNSWLLLYPKGELADLLRRDPKARERVANALNNISTETLVSVGRVYGGGLHKLEPKELASAPAGHIMGAAHGRP